MCRILIHPFQIIISKHPNLKFSKCFCEALNSHWQSNYHQIIPIL
jgi:hypothetical protein